MEASRGDQSIVSEIILDIYSTPVFELLLECSRKLRKVIPFDHSYTNLNDQANKFREIFNYRSDDTDEQTLASYASYYHEIDFISWCYKQREPMTFRATDLVSPSTIEKSRIHREWQSRINVFYTATACIASDDILYGTISLMRSKESGDFSDDEMLVLDEVNQHLCNRFKLTFPNGVNRLMMDASIDPIAATYSFTPREWEITCLMMHGFSRASIAEKLTISVNTLKKHIANIYRKMNVNNASQFFAAIGRVDIEPERYGDGRLSGVQTAASESLKCELVKDESCVDPNVSAVY